MTRPAQPRDRRRLPSLGDIQSLSRVGLVDIMGGQVLAFGALGLLAVVLVLDTFGLGILASINSRAFKPSCGLGSSAASGGFALMLVAFLIVNMLLAQLWAPRSNWTSWLFVLVACCIPFALMNAVANPAVGVPMTGALNLSEIFREIGSSDFRDRLQTSPDQVTWFGHIAFGGLSLLDWALGLDCAGGSAIPALDRLHDRYTTGDVMTQSMAPHVLAYSMMLNLVLLAAWTALLMVFSPLALLWRLFRRRAPAAVPVARGAERTIVVWLAVGSLLAVLAAPVWVALSSNPGPLSESLQNLIWIAPLVLVLDMARLHLFQAAQGAAPEQKDDPQTQDQAATGGLILPVAQKAIDGELGSSVLLKFQLEPGQGGDSRQTLFQLRSDIGSLVFLEQALTPELLFGMGSQMAGSVLDKGASVLVLCPADSVAEVRRQFSEALIRLEGDTHVGWMSELARRDADRTSQQIDSARNAADIIVTAPEGLEELLRASDDYEQFLTRLGGLVIVQAHGLDLGLVRASLNRLAAMVPAAGSLQVLVQSESRHGLHDDTVGKLPMLAAINNREVFRGQDFGLHRGHGFVMIETAPTDRGGTERNDWPTWLRAMIAARRAAPAASTAFVNRDFRFARQAVVRTVEQVLRQGGEATLADWVRDLPVVQIAPPSGRSPLAVIDDRWNLADALTCGTAEEQAQEAMTVVTVGGYPTSRFLLAQLREATRSAARGPGGRRQALDAFSNRFGSIMPAPGDGPAELMLMTVRELDVARRTSTWVNQDRLRQLWSNANTAVLEQLRIRVGAAGIRQLFQVASSRVLQGNEIDQSREGDMSRRFRLRSAAAQGALTLEMLRVHIGNPVERFLPAADHGLSYAQGTRMVIDGIVHKVASVDTQARQVRLDIANTTAAPRTDFVRDYASPVFMGSESLYAAEAPSLSVEVQQPYALALGYVPFARRTREAKEWATDAAPLSATESPLTVACSIDSALRLRRIACLNLLTTGPGTQQRGRSQPTAPDHAVSARVAFTLACTLNDVVAALFPMQAHRVAILHGPLPTGSGALPQPQPGREDRVLAYALARQPRLVPLSEAGLADGAPGQPDLQRRMADEGRKFATAFMQRARQNTDAAIPDSRLSLLLVEDSDHDLGVATAFAAQFRDRVLPFWADYLQWCDKEPVKGATHPYGFGTGEIPQVFDFAEAARIVKAM